MLSHAYRAKAQAAVICTSLCSSVPSVVNLSKAQIAGYHRGHRDSQRVMVAGDVIISPNVIYTVAIGRVQILSRVIYADFVEEPFDLFVDLGSLADD